jgi:hypothetical protein
MKYYFFYLNDRGKTVKKEFTNAVDAVKWKNLWCANYVALRYDTVRKNLEKQLGVKVASIADAEELYANLMADAKENCFIKDEKQLRESLRAFADESTIEKVISCETDRFGNITHYKKGVEQNGKINRTTNSRKD